MQLNKMMKNRKIKFIGSFLILGILTIMLCSLVYAIGVGSSYSKDSPLKIYPGEEKIVFLSLQNPDIKDEITLEGKILEGAEIASLDKSSFKVPYQATDVFAKMTVKVSSEASIGQKYSVVYEFRQVSGGEQEGGTVSFSQGIKRRFDVVVVEKPIEEAREKTRIGMWLGLLIVSALVIVIVAYFIIRAKRK